MVHGIRYREEGPYKRFFRTFRAEWKSGILSTLLWGAVLGFFGYLLAVLLTMTQSAVSHQLRILRDARLVKSRKQGRGVYYSLDDDHIDHIFAMAFEHIMERMEG